MKTKKRKVQIKMSFENEVKEFCKDIKTKLEHIDSEETTKIALIMPFLRILGYDTTNPAEVRAEYTADVGTKQGEKVDLAILENDEPIIFIECKQVSNPLTSDHISQLYRYFSITDIQIGILTNGVEYKFFTTGDDNNRMAEKPFLDIDLLNLTKNDIKELEKFVKNNFDIDEIVTRADDLKYRNLIKKTLINELEDPSEEFIKTIGKQVYDGVLTQSIKERFGLILTSVSTEIINEKVEKRLADAVARTDVSEEKEEVQETEKEAPVTDDIVTTPEELEGYYIIKSIAAEVTDSERITIRDRKSYCNVLLDDHQFYTIVRFHFNNPDNLKIELFDNVEVGHNGMKIGDKIDIKNVSDIYSYKKRILNIIKNHIELKDTD